MGGFADGSLGFEERKPCVLGILDGSSIKDHTNQPHSTSTLRGGEHIDAKRPLEESSPSDGALPRASRPFSLQWAFRGIFLVQGDVLRWWRFRHIWQLVAES
jgi:hypothetical protein